MKSIVSLLIGSACFLLASCARSNAPSAYDVRANQHSGNYRDQLIVLRMAALKGFEGSVFYVGSDVDFDYFRVEKRNGYFRANREKVKLRERFSIGSGKQYEVGFDVLIKKSNI